MSQPLTYPAPPAPAQRRSSAGKIVGIVVAAIAVLAGIAFGALLMFAKPTLDEAKVQAEIVRITHDASGLDPTDVHCPTNVALHAGDVSTCTAQLDGQPVTYEVRQGDDKGNVHIQSSGFVVVDTIEKTLVERVGQSTDTTVTATCADGKKVVVGGKGTTIACTVVNTADPTDTLPVTATVSDDKGTVDFS
jgi:hypothetical protein